MIKKKAYSLVELLVGLLIISIIIGMSISTVFSSGNNGENTIKVKESITRIILLEEDIFAKTGEFQSVDLTSVTTYPNNFITTKENGLKWGLIEDSTIKIIKITCVDESVGFNLALTKDSADYSYNSCTDKKIKKA